MKKKKIKKNIAIKYMRTVKLKGGVKTQYSIISWFTEFLQHNILLY